MEIRAGYKQTKAGIIPIDWDALELGGTVRSIYRGASPRPIDDPKWFDESSKVGWVRISDVTRSKRYLIETTQFLSSLGVKNSRFIPRGALIMSICATVGRPIETNLDVCIHDGFVYFEQPKINQSFLYHLLKNIEPKWGNFGQVGSQMNLNTELIKRTVIAKPKSQEEQELIAFVLTDADALIESLEKLIEKKRQIKEGSMQNFFREDSIGEVMPLEEVSSLKGRIGWQGLKQSEFTNNYDEPYLITGMNFKDGAIRWNEVYHISEERYEIAKEIQLKPDDVLMTKDGTIGKMLFIDNIPYPHKATLNSHLLLLRPLQKKYYPKYLYYQMTSKRFKDFIELSKSGTTFFGISQASVGKYPVLLPPLLEQLKIAEILTDIDKEIDLLEVKLLKARQIKQGMMQELLTGRIRLV